MAASDKEISAKETSSPSREEERGEVLKIDIKNTDEAAAYLTNAEHYEPLTPAQHKKFMRKVDMILLPMLFLVATLGAIDKVALGTAALYGLREDNGLVGQQYSWLGSILSLGALVGMFPSSWLIHRLPSAKYLSACSVGWSGCALIMASCHNFAGLAALRFIMGMFEAIIVPGISLILAGFYLKEEQPPRNALVSPPPVPSSMVFFPGLLDISRRLLPWLSGNICSVSMLWSIIAFIWLPGTPMDCFFLTEQEKYHAVNRLAANKTGIVNHTWKWSQAKEAVIDPKTWIIFFFNIAINIPNGGLTTFGGLIIAGLGYSGVNASLLTMPNRRHVHARRFRFLPHLGQVEEPPMLGDHDGLRGPHHRHGCCQGPPRSNLGGQMVGLYLLYTYFGPYVVGIGLAQANTAGHTKKTVVFAILYIGYAVGNLIGPQTFIATQAPAYVGGTISMIVCYCVCIGLMACYWALASWQNKKKSAAAIESAATEDAVESFLDKTDFEQQEGFVYTT
uniref:Major facilitator superfamily (MFS) profile domain-containing protein n=1 Tax=Bionectria ochroleuca TaxID=29856 RepID=A0A8H7NQC4_BIOOC